MLSVTRAQIWREDKTPQTLAVGEFQPKLETQYTHVNSN